MRQLVALSEIFMQKANTIKEPLDILVEATEESLERLKTNLKFPFDLSRSKSLSRLREARANIEYYENQIRDYTESIESHRSSIAQEAEKEKAIADSLPVDIYATQEDMRNELESVARLPWVEKVSIDGTYIVVTTRRDMLKTQFNVRIVMFPRNRWTLEHLPEPVVASMPKYQIRINTENLGNSFSNNNSLGIRLADAEEISEYRDLTGLVGHERQMHWGSNGATGALSSWAHLCLGEYADDIREVSKKSLAALFNELSVYLQNSGDGGNAYRTKQNWALGLGKASYYEFITRKAKSGETKEGIEEQYKKDYKILNPVPEGTRTVDRSDIQAAGVLTASAIRRFQDAQHAYTGWSHYSVMSSVNGSIETPEPQVTHDESIITQEDFDRDVELLSDQERRMNEDF